MIIREKRQKSEYYSIAMDADSSLCGMSGELVGKNIGSVLGALETSQANYVSWQNKLQGYRFVEDLEGLEYGCYVRWINLEGAPKLVNGGIVIEVKIDDAGMIIVCKNALGRMFQFNFDASLVFAKLTSQERIMLQTIEYLNERT